MRIKFFLSVVWIWIKVRLNTYHLAVLTQFESVQTYHFSKSYRHINIQHYFRRGYSLGHISDPQKFLRCHLNVLIFRRPLLTKWDGTLPLCVGHAYNWYLLKAYDLESMLYTFIGVWKSVENFLESFEWKKSIKMQKNHSFSDLRICWNFRISARRNVFSFKWLWNIFYALSGTDESI